MESDDAIKQIKSMLTLPMIDKMAKNEMPDCFEFTRETGVALAQLLMDSMRANEELVNALQQDPATRH